MKGKVHNNSVGPYKFYYSAAFLIAGVSFFAAYKYLPFLTIFASYCLAINISAFVFMGFDKSIAGTESMRVPEKVFYVVAAFGGTIGVLFGAQLFWHKTRKASFLLVVLFILAAQLALFQFSKLPIRSIFLQAAVNT